MWAKTTINLLSFNNLPRVKRRGGLKHGISDYPLQLPHFMIIASVTRATILQTVSGFMLSMKSPMSCMIMRVGEGKERLKKLTFG